MEKVSTSTLSHSLSLGDAVVFLSLYVLLDCVIGIQKSSVSFLSFLASCAEFFSYSSKINSGKPATSASGKCRRDQGLVREDVEAVLERLRISCSHEGEQLKEYVSCDELSNLFEEEPPSLDEVREAFSVFDENCDGYIDAMELQRVLSKMGLGEGFTLDDCKQMIAVHDENRDGRIDFSEFAKFLQSGLC